MSATFVHTCIRVRDIDASVEFYNQLGFEHRGRLNFESAYNVYLGLPGNGDVLELTVNVGHEEPNDIGEGYNHVAIAVDHLDALLSKLAAAGITPVKPPYAPRGRWCRFLSCLAEGWPGRPRRCRAGPRDICT